MDEKEKNTKKNLWFYPIGTIGRDMVYALFSSFILTYIMLTRSLTTGQLGAITAIMIAARVFDAVNDPIMGFIIEKTHTKWGKFKPWLLAGVVSTAGVIITIFNTRLQGWGFIALFGVIYFLYSITYTMNDISYWGMIPSLSSDADTRNKFTSRTVLFAGIGSTLAGMLIPMFTVGSMTLGGSTQIAYGIIAIIISALSIGFLCFTIFGVKESKEAMQVKKDVKRKSIKEIIKTIFKNKPLLWIIIAFILQQIGNNIVAGGIGANYIYFQYGYEGSYYSLFSTIGVAATAVLMIFYPMISRKINRKPLMTIMLFVALGGYALMALTAIPAVSAGQIGFWMLTIGYMLSNFGQYGFYLIMMISIMNTVEYNELISGEREEAVITSVRPFVTKMASAIVVGVTSLSYIIFHVTDYTNQISDLENACTKGEISAEDKISQINTVIGSVDQGQKIGMLIFMIVVPLVLLVGAYLVYKFKYPLDEKEYDRICGELAKRKQPEDVLVADAPIESSEAVGEVENSVETTDKE